MAKTILIIAVFFYILVLLQTSFLVYFDIKGMNINLILIFVILINIFEKQQNYSGLFSAVIGGFFLDIFSENFVGFWVLILVGIAIFIKFILKKYVRVPTPKRV